MNTRQLPAWLLSGLCLLASASCDKTTTEPGPDAVQVSYAQTQCADPWGFVGSTQQLTTVATAYLAQKGIALSSPKATQTSGPAACLACTCGTGVTLVGYVSAKDLPAVQALGFKK